MRTLLLTCGLMAVLTACATSQPSPTAEASPAAAPTAVAAAGTAAAPQAAPAPAKGKMVCEDSSRIDSHFKQRVCMTPEEVEARRKAAQTDMQNYQNSSVCAQGGGGGSCGGPPR